MGKDLQGYAPVHFRDAAAARFKVLCARVAQPVDLQRCLILWTSDVRKTCMLLILRRASTSSALHATLMMQPSHPCPDPDTRRCCPSFKNAPDILVATPGRLNDH
eukprot:895862-Rhodomonas_salina.1